MELEILVGFLVVVIVVAIYCLNKKTKTLSDRLYNLAESNRRANQLLLQVALINDNDVVGVNTYRKLQMARLKAKMSEKQNQYVNELAHFKMRMDPNVEGMMSDTDTIHGKIKSEIDSIDKQMDTQRWILRNSDGVNLNKQKESFITELNNEVTNNLDVRDMTITKFIEDSCSNDEQCKVNKVVSVLHFLTGQSVDIASNAVIANYKADVGGDTREISNMYDIIKAVFQGFDEKVSVMTSRLLYEFDKISDNELEMRITGMCEAVADVPNVLPSYMDKVSAKLFGESTVTHSETASSMQQKMHDNKMGTSGPVDDRMGSMKLYQTSSLRIEPVGYVKPPVFIPDPNKQYTSHGYITSGMLPSSIMNTEIAEKMLLFIHTFLTNMSTTVSKFCNGERKRSDVRELLVNTIDLAQKQYNYWKVMGVVQIGHMYSDYRKVSNDI
jgi:hypothetical protein